jgi:hypothetical protein
MTRLEDRDLEPIPGRVGAPVEQALQPRKLFERQVGVQIPLVGQIDDRGPRGR